MEKPMQSQPITTQSPNTTQTGHYQGGSYSRKDTTLRHQHLQDLKKDPTSNLKSNS